jgi:hypothetical protein
MLRLEVLRTKLAEGAKAEADARERARVAAESFMVVMGQHKSFAVEQMQQDDIFLLEAKQPHSGGGSRICSSDAAVSTRFQGVRKDDDTKSVTHAYLRIRQLYIIWRLYSTYSRLETACE